jgi:dihydroorotase
MSLSVLDEAVDEEECLECLISKQPASVLAAIGRPGRDLLLRLLSTEAGLDYLSRENDFISGALQYWKETGTRLCALLNHICCVCAVVIVRNSQTCTHTHHCTRYTKVTSST